jgi:DNA-binding transcriptional regulator YhcF (GntR family)
MVAMKNYLKIIEFDEYSITPKYLQLFNSLLRGIEDGKIEKDDILPSINDLSIALETSRNTIERVYNELKKMGIVKSIPGKGYFISDTDFNKPVKVLLLFNKLSSHKKIIYDAFAETLGSKGAIDFYIYNNDFTIFRKLVSENLDNYTKFVIIPHFLENTALAHEVINQIPKEKLILMDKLVTGVTGRFSAVYENFEKDIYSALESLVQKLSRFNTLKIIFPETTYHTKDILKGFKNFCREYAFEYEIIHDLKADSLVPGTVYISLMEDDLVELVEKAISQELKIGDQIGVISYNETPLKKIILDGITTISTDFKMMGVKAAEMVLSGTPEYIEIPFKVTLRNSL